MYLKLLVNFILFTFLLFSNDILYARQAKTVSEKPTVKIELKDGTELLGQVEKVGEDSLIITSDRQTQYIATKDIFTIQYLTKKQTKHLNWSDNPNKLGYLFASSALRLKPGELYFKSTYIVLNAFHVGITNRISAGVTVSLPAAGIICGNVKANLISGNNFNFATGLSYMHLENSGIVDYSNNNEIENLGFVYGAATWGTPNQNLTVGAGYLFVGADPSATFPVNFMVAGTLRIAKNVSLITDNWFLFSGTGFPFFYSYGARWFIGKHSLDFAFINTSTMAFGTTLGIPFVSYTLKLIDPKKKRKKLK